TNAQSEQTADLKLSLRDWPSSENDAAVVHVEVGKVPDVRGLALKSAVHRVVLAGGVPGIEGLAGGAQAAYLVAEQSPAPGEALEPGATVQLRLKKP
ncbi:MAG TPA: PASTA domain-containing protein, partial [Holophaga sp.]|nr:PASTA domain-containing protein [Holophaga sp.]